MALLNSLNGKVDLLSSTQSQPEIVLTRKAVIIIPLLRSLFSPGQTATLVSSEGLESTVYILPHPSESQSLNPCQDRLSSPSRLFSVHKDRNSAERPTPPVISRTLVAFCPTLPEFDEHRYGTFIAKTSTTVSSCDDATGCCRCQRSSPAKHG